MKPPVISVEETNPERRVQMVSKQQVCTGSLSAPSQLHPALVYTFPLKSGEERVLLSFIYTANPALNIGQTGQSHNTDNGRAKRSRHAPPAFSSPRYLILHQVKCEPVGTHTNHKTESEFFDTPRLFAGDSKASSLRGKKPAAITQDYLEDHPEISFIVYKLYSCNNYYEEVKDNFDRLPTLPIDPAVLP
jgi:hypothetical protein